MKPGYCSIAHLCRTFQRAFLMWINFASAIYLCAQCDPATIDLCQIGKNSVIQASYHAQIIKTSNGYSITGQNLAPDGINFQTVLSNIPSSVYPMPQAVFPVWGALGGRSQAVFVASDSKIYALGKEGLMISQSFTRGSAWGVTSLELPDGLTVCDISKWEGSAGSLGAEDGFLAFSTFAGTMYITGSGAPAIQANAKNNTWTKMVLPAGVEVKDFAAGHRTLLVLGNDRKLYASGPFTFLGSGSPGSVDRLTLMTQPNISPNGITQIEAGLYSYFVLDGDGTIHVLGSNEQGSLGIGNTDDLQYWSKVGADCPNGILQGVAYISTLSTHDNRSASSAILINETIMSWGMNDNQSITSGPARIITCPIQPEGNNNSAVAVANGGHITPYVNRNIQICNIGHNREGAFGDGRDESGDYGSYACFNIPGLPEICGTQSVDLELEKMTTNDSLEIGDEAVFTITIKNNGPGASTGSTVRDQIPSGYRYISDDGDGKYDPGTGLWTVGPLGKGKSDTLKITVRIKSTGDYTNYAQIFSDNEIDPDSSPGDSSKNQDDDAEAKVPVIPCPFEAVCKSLSDISVNSCEKLIPVIYDAGRGDAEINVVFADIVSCGELGIFHTDYFPDEMDCSILRRSYSLTDDGQVVKQCFRDFTFLPDDVGPDVFCPEDLIVTCGDPIQDPVLTLSGKDDCSDANAFRVTDVTEPILSEDICLTKAEVYQRIYATEDQCGNVSTCIQSITLEPEFYIPNVFSPPGKSNKVWTLSHSANILLLECNIFDRWGNLVYVSKSEKPEWPGTFKGEDCVPGIYTYILQYKNTREEIKVKTGEIALLR